MDKEPNNPFLDPDQREDLARGGRTIDGRYYSQGYLDSLRKNAPMTYYVLMTGL